jgi:hypothetical protein
MAKQLQDFRGFIGQSRPFGLTALMGKSIISRETALAEGCHNLWQIKDLRIFIYTANTHC